ncbi:MAG: fused MFS/spermidine synthase [Verrucomicrobia bacterium]|nr:fused MFS/spermidine synthase [Verrucomicrobiota bacterium]MBT7068896.1 fused MFS/spermidine synthase [Verrucomicrobiota bacterium]MBT7701947.1 fused MFS/spermidine synthase [Verrucomicrobiota bacterium]
MDEVVWVRLLKLTLGNTVYATSVVISVFLGGLALGAFLMGRWCGHVRRPLRLYALIETLITISVLLLPWLLNVGDSVYVRIYQRYTPTFGRLTAVQVLISACVLLVPTALMGSTLPLLARYVGRVQERLGYSVGRLYALNMFGAAVGTFLAGFVVIRALGVWGTIYAAAGLNLLVALAAWHLSRGETAAAGEARDTAEPTPSASDAVSRGALRPALLLLAVFLSGFISIGYELVWMRSVVHLLGADTYVFSAVLTMYLLGNVAGAWIGSRLAGFLRNPAAGFGLSMSVLGLAGLVYMPWLIFWSDHPGEWLWLLEGRMSAELLVWAPPAMPIVHAVGLFIVPSILMGVGFPMALEAWHGFQRGTGRPTSVVYSVNTIGAVLSGIATGFLCIPLLGIQGTIVGFGTAGMVTGVVVLATGDRFRLRRVAIVGSACACIAMWFAVPGDLFIRRMVTYPHTELLDVDEGVTTTVSVHEEQDGDLWLCTSGIQVAGDELKSVQRMLGHFGMLLHPDPRSVLSVGFGSGETTRCLAMHRPERLDCVEISPELAQMSLRHFRDTNLGDELHDHVNMIYMDAKNYLHLTDRTYDLIINDSISPKAFAENASLYTREYFQSALDHLNPDGMLVCWTPFNMPPDCFKSVVGTFAEVFPHVTVWFPTVRIDHCVLLIGSASKQVFDPELAASRLSKPDVAENLNGIHLFDTHDLFSCYFGDREDLQDYIQGYRPNSDYTPYVEFSPHPFLTERGKWEFLLQFADSVRRGTAEKHLNMSAWEDGSRSAYTRDLDLLDGFTAHVIRLTAGENIVLDDQPERLVARLDEYLARHDRYIHGYVIRALMLRGLGRPQDAIRDAGRALDLDPENHFALRQRAGLHVAQGMFREALSDLDRAITGNPDDFVLHFNRGLSHVNVGEFAKGIEDYSTALAMTEMHGEFVHRENIFYRRALAHHLAGDHASAVADFTEAIGILPSNPTFQAGRAVAHFERGQYEASWGDILECERLGGRVDPGFRAEVEKMVKGGVRPQK